MPTIASTLSVSPDAGAGWTPAPLYPLSLEQYERMVDAGILGKRDHVHLINGILVERMTQEPPHILADGLCGDALARVLPAGWFGRGAKPVRIPGCDGRRDSKPEPDRSAVRGTVRDYTQRSPDPADIALVAEVADSSLAADREYGARLYGPAGIPVYWIVNLVDRHVEVYTGPGPTGYASRVDFKPGEAIPVMIGGQPVGEIAVDDLLP